MSVQDVISEVLAFAHHAPFILIKWAVLICLLAMLSILFYSENFKLPSNQSLQNDRYFQSVFALARKRGWYALILFSMYILTVIIYDIALYRSGRSVHENAAMDAVEPAPEKAPAKPATVPTAPASTTILKPGGNDVVSVFDGVTVFSEKNGQVESFMDEMKQRYEPILITYFILERCKMTDTNAFLTLQDKILDDLTKISGSSVNLTRFIDASRGSYEELYSEYDCSKPELAKMKAGFDANIQRYRTKPVNAAPAQ